MNASDQNTNTWTLGFNDPSLIAWLLVAAYLCVAYLCWRAGKRTGGGSQATSAPLWTLLALSFVLMGVNKQLDLHQPILDALRNIWTDQSGSKPIFWDSAILAVAGMVAIALGISFFTLLHKATRLAQWSFGILVSLLAAQAVRFLGGPVSELLVTHVFADEGILHIHLIELLELACLGAVGILSSRTQDNF